MNLKSDNRQTAWRRANPAAYEAHKAVQNAVKAGIIHKPQQCELCGSDGRLDGHHPDHRDPLRVIFLCRGCHVRLHKRPGFPAPTSQEVANG